MGIFIKNNYHPKLIGHVIDETPKALFGVSMVSIIFIWVYLDYIPKPYLLAWIAVQIIFIFLRLYNMKMLSKSVENGDIKGIKLHISIFIIIITYSAIVWSTGTILGAIFAPTPYELVSFIMITGIVSGGIISISSVFNAFSIYFLIMILTQFIIMLFFGEEVHIALTLFTIIFIPVILLLSKSIYNNHLYTIEATQYLETSVIELEVLSTTDSLTGIYNRRYFFQTAQNYIIKSKLNNQMLFMLMMDIDYFKKINDTYGHQAGDYVLVALSQEIDNITRDSDVFARVGGEEFALLFRNLSLELVKKIAEKIRKMIEKKVFIYEGNVINVTISIGMSEFGENVSTLEELHHNADTQLYKAKELGRNIVC